AKSVKAQSPEPPLDSDTADTALYKNAAEEGTALRPSTKTLVFKMAAQRAQVRAEE
ncbi:hypothetical protein DFQ27_001813, partial [Actinomortierella ambigua]